MSLSNWKPLRDRQLMAIATARLQAMTPRIPERKRSVYLLKIGEMFKIGLSVDPEARIKCMQLPSKPDWVKAFELPYAAELERVLHKRFANKREYGEWFLLNGADVRQIERICTHWKKTKRARKASARLYQIRRKA